ncbi:MAG: 30S ribosomal protein S4 [Acidobacteriota bacterium]
MGRLLKPDCKLCRTERVKLFLKGKKCISEKCPLEKRPYSPGEHGKSSRAKIAGFSIQLREKQKVKRYYGLLEKQFKLYFKKSDKMKGITGENLLSLLERRLDNVLYRLGFSLSRAHARQLISHGYIKVNDVKVDIPSYLTKEGDVISFKNKIFKSEILINMIKSNKETVNIPSWLEADFENLRGKIIHLPKREDVSLPVEEHLVVELYSR